MKRAMSVYVKNVIDRRTKYYINSRLDSKVINNLLEVSTASP